jgi:MATE family multidrug resistance protein
MRTELRAMLSLAWPLVLAEMGWVLMGIVDTIMVGPLGPAALGAVGTGSTMFFAIVVLGLGTFFALDTFVSQNFGAGNIAECHRWLFTGLQLALILSVVLVVVGLAGVELLRFSGIHPDVLTILQPYLRRLLISAPPLLVYAVCRRYLQAMNVVRPVMVVIVITNVVNAVGNWVFVYGHLGVPALGAVGSAYATIAARVVLAGLLWGVILQRERRWPSGLHDAPFVWDLSRIWRLVRLGMPAAAQVTLEVGVFAVASALAGRISPVALAVNQVALNIASFFFMVPYGISSAAAVRVGQAVGRGDVRGVERGGWVALGIALVFAVVIAAGFLLIPQAFLRVFTADPAVVATGVTVLAICAVFQPFDGFQVDATGALRGLGDTRTPMLANLGYHWLVGLPLGAYLCFSRQWGVVGLWTGLSLSLILVGSTLIAMWRRESRSFCARHPRAGERAHTAT